MKQRLIRQLLLPAVMAVLAAGCGQPGVSMVKGKVLYNGEPLSGADVEFKPESDLTLGACVGQTNSAGDLEIKVGKGTGQNAKAGRYVVLISKGRTIGLPPPGAFGDDEEGVKAKMAAGPGRAVAGGGTAAGILPDRYGSAATTPFKVELSEGVNDLNPFRLEGPPLKK